MKASRSRRRKVHELMQNNTVHRAGAEEVGWVEVRVRGVCERRNTKKGKFRRWKLVMPSCCVLETVALTNHRRSWSG